MFKCNFLDHLLGPLRHHPVDQRVDHSSVGGDIGHERLQQLAMALGLGLAVRASGTAATPLRIAGAQGAPTSVALVSNS